MRGEVHCVDVFSMDVLRQACLFEFSRLSAIGFGFVFDLGRMASFSSSRPTTSADALARSGRPRSMRSVGPSMSDETRELVVVRPSMSDDVRAIISSGPLMSAGALALGDEDSIPDLVSRRDRLNRAAACASSPVENAPEPGFGVPRGAGARACAPAAAGAIGGRGEPAPARGRSRSRVRSVPRPREVESEVVDLVSDEEEVVQVRGEA